MWVVKVLEVVPGRSLKTRDPPIHRPIWLGTKMSYSGCLTSGSPDREETVSTETTGPVVPGNLRGFSTTFWSKYVTHNRNFRQLSRNDRTIILGPQRSEIWPKTDFKDPWYSHRIETFNVKILNILFWDLMVTYFRMGVVEGPGSRGRNYDYFFSGSIPLSGCTTD